MGLGMSKENSDFHNTPWFETIQNGAVKKKLKKGEIYNRQGEALDNIGLIISGKANAISYSVNGDETWIGEYTIGQFIGLVPLLGNGVSDFEIRAASKLQVLIISHDYMLSLMDEDPAICQAVANDLAKRLDASFADIIDIHTLSVRGRICAELIRRAIPIGIDPDQQIIRPSPVFVELARKLNSTRETVSRTVSELQNKGIVSREPGALIIKDPKKLRETVDYI